ncbi:MAG: hypothetical protein CMD88_03155 [Gammaproteobacteria bacterium]|nr:hypothetical protein [Gammaproteobacteria bacterium]|tara:strand:+ start:246 stop:1160 length:915 start_codon:yes stop_codon:yes gene_type:complete
MLNKIRNYFSFDNPLRLIILLLIIGLLYGGFSMYGKYMYYSKFANTAKIISVKVTPITIGPAIKSYQALSTIEASKSSELKSRVNGIIEKIHFKETEKVVKGQQLFSIISSDKVGRTIIFSPFDGYVGLSRVNVGERVTKGRLLTTVDNNDVMKLVFNLPENILGYLNRNIKFTATSDLIPNRKYEGRINFIDTRIDTQSRTIKVYALIDNEKNILKPGIFMKVNLVLLEKKDSYLIPEESIVNINSKHFVYIVENDIAKLREVSIGIRSNDMIEIEKGLNAKDIVIFLGQEKLKDGSTINIIN